MPKEWVENLEHDGLTDEGRAILDKFETSEDAHIGYIELQKSAGKPFKLPESMDAVDKWPNENDKKAFREKVSALTIPKDVLTADNIKEINFADGLADARTVSEDLKKAISDFAIEKKLPKSLVQELVSLNNRIGQEMANKIQQQTKKEFDDKLKKTKDILSPLFGGEEGLKENNELVRRMYQNNSGLTAEEYESMADAVIGRIAQDPAFAKAQYNLARQFAESQTEKTEKSGEKKTESLKERQNREFPIITGHLWPKK